MFLIFESAILEIYPKDVIKVSKEVSTSTL